MTLAPARVCGSCESFPCRCDERPRLLIASETRYERCVCGGTIVAKSQADIFPAVRAHNASAGHNLWRARTWL